MSDAADPGLILQSQQYIVDNYISIATLALAGYEYAFTFHHVEGKFLSARKEKWMTIRSWLLLASRYLMVVNAIQQFVPYSMETCQYKIRTFLSVFLFLPYVVTAVFAALRVFAMAWSQKYLLSGAVMCLSLVTPAINFWLLSKGYYLYVYYGPIAGNVCLGGFSVSDTAFFHLSLASRLPLIAADLIVLLVTWRSTYYQAKQHKMIGSKSLSMTLLLDGSIYFVVLLLLNILILVINAVPSLALLDQGTVIYEILQPVLVSRFIINLGEVGEDHQTFPDRNLSAYSDVVFAGLQRLGRTVETMADDAGQELKFDWQKEEDSDRPLGIPEGNGTDYFLEVTYSEPQAHSTSFSQEDIKEEPRTASV